MADRADLVAVEQWDATHLATELAQLQQLTAQLEGIAAGLALAGQAEMAGKLLAAAGVLGEMAVSLGELVERPELLSEVHNDLAKRLSEMGGERT